MRATIKNTFFILAPFLLIIGCDDNSNRVDEPFRYPLTVGNRWEYRREYVMTSWPDSTMSDSLISTVTGDDSCSIIVVQETTILDSIPTVQLMEQTWEDSAVVIGLYYYQERDTGLFLLAYQNPYLNATPKPVGPETPIFEPLLPSYLKNAFAARLSKTQFINDIYYEDPPVFVLKYPLEVGTNWTYRYQPWYIPKTVLSDTTITLECGTFDCRVVRLYYDFSDVKVVIDDYIAGEGLVLRKISSKGYFYDNNDNYTFSVFDDEYRLMNYDVAEK